MQDQKCIYGTKDNRNSKFKSNFNEGFSAAFVHHPAALVLQHIFWEHNRCFMGVASSLEAKIVFREENETEPCTIDKLWN